MIWVSAALAGDLLLVSDPDLDGDALSAAAGLAEATVVPMSEVPLPGGARVWVGGGQARYCAGAQQPLYKIVELVKEGRKAMDYGENGKARDAFRDAEALLACADDAVTPETLWDMYFLAGVLGAEDDPDESVRLFEAAGLARPEGTWSDDYPPAIKDLYVKGRERIASAKRVQFAAFDPRETLATVFVDGRAVDSGADLNLVTVGQHLVQVKSGLGDTLSMLVDVDGSGNVTVVPASAVPDLLVEPEQEGLAGSLLASVAAKAGAARVGVADGATKSLRVYADGAFTEASWSGRARSTAKADSDSLTVDVVGSVAVFPTFETGKVMAGPAALLAVPAGPLALDLGAGAYAGPATDGIVVLPMARAGLRFGGPAYVGGAATLGVHGVGPRLGGGLIGGVKAGPVVVDVLAGLNRKVQLQASVGVRL